MNHFLENQPEFAPVVTSVETQPYQAPAVVLVTDLVTRAGSPLGVDPLDPFGPELP